MTNVLCPAQVVTDLAMASSVSVLMRGSRVSEHRRHRQTLGTTYNNWKSRSSTSSLAVLDPVRHFR
jgi:hypothetical protein